MASEPRPRRSGPGCLLALLLLPVVVLVGVLVGSALSGPEKPEDDTAAVTLDEGSIDGVTWRVDAVRDVDDQPCTFLYEDDAEAPLNGACTPEPQDVTFGDQTVVFGRVDDGVDRARVRLDDGEVVEVDTVDAEGVDGRFYVIVVEGDVNAEALESG
jgi:hypothetical protein